MTWLLGILGVVSAGGVGYMFVPSIREWIDKLLGREPNSNPLFGSNTGNGQNRGNGQPNNDQSAQLAQQQAALQQAQAQLAQAQAAQTTAEATAAGLQTQLTQTQTQNATLTAQLQTARTEATRQQAALQQAQAQQAAAQANVTQLAQTIAALQTTGATQQAALQTQITALQTSLTQSQAQTTQTTEQAAQRRAALQAQIDALQTQLTRSQEQRTEEGQQATQREAALRAQVATFQTQLQQAQAALAGTTTNTAQAQVNQQRAQAALQALQEQNAVAQTRIEQLERELGRLRNVNIDGSQSNPGDHYFVPRIEGGRIYHLNNNRLFRRYTNGDNGSAVPVDPQPQEELREVSMALPNGAGWEAVTNIAYGNATGTVLTGDNAATTATHIIITIRDPSNNQDATVLMPRNTSLRIRGPQTRQPAGSQTLITTNWQSGAAIPMVQGADTTADPIIQDGSWQMEGSPERLITLEDLRRGRPPLGENPDADSVRWAASTGLNYLQYYGNSTYLLANGMRPAHDAAPGLTLSGLGSTALDIGSNIIAPLRPLVTPVVDFARGLWPH